MATLFTTAQANLVKYWYEKLPYTSLISSLSSGNPTSIFNVNDLGASTSGTKLAIMSDIAATPSANVSLGIGHSDTTVQTDTMAFPTNLVTVQTGEDGGVRSTRKLSLSITNTGAAVNNFQTNYCVAVKNLSTADKVLRGLTLTQQDRVLQQKYSIAQQGIRPLSVSEMLNRAFKGRILDETEYIHYVPSISATTQTTIDTYRVNAGEMLIITSLAANAPVGNNVQINISRDSDDNYAQVLADNMVINQPVPVWIPATRYLSVTAQANVASTNVPIRIKVLRVKLSTVLHAMIGDISPSQLSGEDLNLYNSVIAGVIV